MAIKISGTTVIDNNRNANNLVNISATSLDVTGNLTGTNITLTGNVSSSDISSSGATVSGAVTVSGTLTSANNYSNTYVESIKTVSTLANAVSLDLSSFQNFEHQLANNVTYTFANAPQSSAFGFTLKLIQDPAATGYSVTWPASVNWPSAAAPTLTNTANGVDMMVFTTNDGGTNFYGFVASLDLRK
tara:strand:- start:82 stop:645 length:564 start_codon:yes stop_codon:yes gene_type:complete